MNIDPRIKNKAFFLIPIIIVALIAPTGVALAQFLGFGMPSLDFLTDGVKWGIAGIIQAIPVGLLTISSLMLQQSIDPQFIRVPYTTGGVIDVAWPITRDFANMLLVLILIFIGLGTALRLGDYEAKKALPRLFGVAILINFAPVLMGFFVDATNIIMNFFMEGLIGPQVLGTIGTNLNAAIQSSSGNSDFGAFIVKMLAIAFFNVLTAIIFFFFATLFFVRKVTIWILVILSPIALISLILPATKGFFTQWRDQFFQWSTVGIFAAFFLWLGDHTIAFASKGGFTSQIPQTITGGGIADILNETIPFIIADMVLLIGFFMALQSNAMGFNTLKSQSFAQQKWAGKILGSAAWRKASKPLDKAGTKLQQLGGLGTRGAEWVAGGFEKTPGLRVLGKVPGVTGAVRYALRAPGGAIQALGSVSKGVTAKMRIQDDKEIADSKKEFTNRNPEDIINAITIELAKGNFADMNKVVGAMNGIIENGDVDDMLKAIEQGRLNMADLKRTYQAAFDRGTHVSRPISKGFVGYMDDLGVTSKEQESTLKRLSNADFTGDRVATAMFDPSKGPGAQRVLEKIVGEKGIDVLPGMLSAGTRTQQQNIWKHIQSLDEEWYINNEGSERILTWSTDTAARRLGIEPLLGLTGVRRTKDEDPQRRTDAQIKAEEIREKRVRRVPPPSGGGATPGTEGGAQPPPDTGEGSTARANPADTGEGASGTPPLDTGAGTQQFVNITGSLPMLKRGLMRRGGYTNEQINAMTDDEVRTAYTRMQRGEV